MSGMLRYALVQGVLTVGDYDGVISQMDVSSGHLLADRDEHNGQRYVVALLESMLGFSASYLSDVSYLQCSQVACQRQVSKVTVAHFLQC